MHKKDKSKNISPPEGFTTKLGGCNFDGSWSKSVTDWTHQVVEGNPRTPTTSVGFIFTQVQVGTRYLPWGRGC